MYRGAGGGVLWMRIVRERKSKKMKHLGKTIVATGAALLLSGGVAAAALGTGTTGAGIVSALPGGVALFVEHGPFGGANVLSVAATYIGISEADLRTALQSGKSLAQVAVDNGKTRDGLIAALTQAATTRIGTFVDQTNPFPQGGPGGPGRGGMFGFGGDEMTVVTGYLGVAQADLQTQLQSGKTLADVANATAGKSADGLIQALVAAETKEIDDAVTAGKITAAQATQMKANLTQRFTDMVNSTRPIGPGGMRPGHGRFGR